LRVIASMMLRFELAEGSELQPAIEKLFGHPNAEYLLHFAAPGCHGGAERA
jgi:hypothetical protein